MAVCLSDVYGRQEAQLFELSVESLKGLLCSLVPGERVHDAIFTISI